MRLSADDLRTMASTLDKIAEARLEVDVVTVRGHRVLLKRTDRQMDGLSYYVIGLTDGELSGEFGKVMRDAQDTAGGQSRGGKLR